MIANQDKCQAIIKTEALPEILKFYEYEITSKIVLLGIEIYVKLKFENHTHGLVRKAAGQLNYLIRKQRVLRQHGMGLTLCNHWAHKFGIAYLMN